MEMALLLLVPAVLPVPAARGRELRQTGREPCLGGLHGGRLGGSQAPQPPARTRRLCPAVALMTRPRRGLLRRPPRLQHPRPHARIPRPPLLLPLLARRLHRRPARDNPLTGTHVGYCSLVSGVVEENSWRNFLEATVAWKRMRSLTPPGLLACFGNKAEAEACRDGGLESLGVAFCLGRSD